MPRNIKFNSLRFGTAGIPLSTEKPSNEEGIKRVRELNLDAMELEFVRGVNVTTEKAKILGKIAKENDVVLTSHAPYYINLNSQEKQKFHASIKRIIDSIKVLHAASGYSVIFHAGYYMKSTKDQTYKRIKEALNKIVEEMKNKKYDVWLRPEVMGKHTQFGDLEELISISKEFYEYVLPGIDFAHYHARCGGCFKEYKDFQKVFDKIEKELGKKALNNMHIHISGIEYTDKGEKRHIPLKESDFPYRDFVKSLITYDVKGVIISESPNIESDALLLKNLYESLI